MPTSLDSHPPWTSSTRRRARERSARSSATGSRPTCRPICVSTTPPTTAWPSDRETFERRRAWQKTMHAAGWVGISWPKEYGGRGASLIERVIWDEEYAAARAPVLPGDMGLNLVGPTIIHWGTESSRSALPAHDPQRRRDLVPGLLRARRRLRPGEPPARAPSTRATTSSSTARRCGPPARISPDWIFLLVRTDPDAPKHQGISCLLVPTEDRRASPCGRSCSLTGHHALQRGVLHRRGGAEGEPARAAQPGLEGHDDHADVRAPLRGRPQPRGAARPADRAGEAATARRAAPAWDDPVSASSWPSSRSTPRRSSTRGCAA